MHLEPVIKTVFSNIYKYCLGLSQLGVHEIKHCICATNKFSVIAA
jgi:hypothetical protein